ncbi:hypothetical protein V2W45_1396388 [Cenococcum geophilum]
MNLENSTDLAKKIEADLMTPEELTDGFNKNMARDGQISHNADELGRTLGKGRRWLVGNYEAGDVAFHNPYLIHRTCMNEDKQGRIRLGTDLRFYGKGAPLDKR